MLTPAAQAAWLVLVSVVVLGGLGMIARLEFLRLRVQQTRAESDGRLRAFASAMPDVSLLLDRSGRYLDVFGPEDQLAAPKAQLIGQNISDFFPPHQSRIFLDLVTQALETHQTQSCEFALQLPTGVRWFEARISAVPGQDMAVWISFDISLRKAALLRVDDLTRLYSFLSQVNQTIVMTHEADELYRRIAQAAISHGHFRAAAVLQVTDGLADFSTAEAPFKLACSSGDLPWQDTRAGAQADAPDWFEATARQAQHSGALAWQHDHHLALDAVALPLRCRGQVVAVLMLMRDTLDPTDREEQALFTEVSADLSFALDQIQSTAERAEYESRMRLHAAALESTQDGVMVTDLQPRIVSVNRAFTEITGYTEAEALGQKPRMLQSGRQEIGFYQDMWRTLKAQGQWQGEIWNRRKSGETYTQWMALSTVRDAEQRPTHYVAVFTDITTKKLAEDKLYRLAHFDPLTQLPNRLMVLDRLDHAIDAAQRQGHGVAVMFIDLDNFKTINDSLGHGAGDDLLHAVADRLSQRTRRDDTLGRLGGDEFILVLERLLQPQDAAPVAQELLNLLNAPFLIAGQEVYVRASLGISVYPGDGTHAGDLVRDADAAMYQAKRAGRGTYRYYTQGLTQAAQTRLALDTRLQRALETQAFELFYQPIYRLSDRCIVGVEALVRLNQPGLPPLAPADFLPALEETGQIGALGQWVLNEACRQGNAWRDAGLAFGRIAVNLSATELRSGQTAERVRTALQASGLPAALLELEVTEAGLMAPDGRAETCLQALRLQGLSFSIDDFGTGYLSLAHLRRFQVGRLKMDRSFINDLGRTPGDAQLVQAMIALGHHMGITVVAEGVETEAQLQALIALGCDAAQGHHLQTPQTAAVIGAILPRQG